MSTATAKEKQEQALARARNGHSKNDLLVMMAFTERGWAPEDVKPRENVFTYKAWQALGRQVRKGEKGVKVCVYITTEETDKKTGETVERKKPWSSTVFHIDQTDPKK